MYTDRYILQLYTPMSPFQQLPHAHVVITIGLFTPPYFKVLLYTSTDSIAAIVNFQFSCELIFLYINTFREV